MNKPVFRLKYSLAGAVYETVGYSGPHFSVITVNDESGVKLTLIPSRPITLISASLEFWHEYEKNEKFFVNGYQSWTTSGEMSAEDIYRGTTPLAGVTKYTKDMAITSGDYAFTRYEPRPGFFHSFTYTYLRRGDEFELFGSLSERNGYTVFYSDMEKHIFSVEKDVEGLTISEPYEMFDIVRFVGGYDEVFEKYFAAMSLPAKKHIDRLTGYTSWYNYFQKIDENIILRDLKGLSRARESVNIFQIDDGYEPFVGDWLDYNGKDFPNGMKTIADAVHREGYLAGIWLAPFGCHPGAQVFADHEDWFVHVPGGGAWRELSFDFTNPEVREYISSIFRRISYDWGFRYIKMDIITGTLAPGAHHDPSATALENYRLGLKTIRDSVTPDTFLLACTAPLGGACGLVDGMRVSCDVFERWESLRDVFNSVIKRYYYHRNYFLCDADCLIIRKKENEDEECWRLCTRSDEEIRTYITAMAASGGILMLSDKLPNLAPEQLELISKLFPMTQEAARPLDLMDSFIPGVLDFGVRASARTVAFINWGDSPRDFSVDCGESFVREFWSGEMSVFSGGKFTSRVQPHCAQVFAFTPIASSAIVGSDASLVMQSEWSADGDAVKGKRIKSGERLYAASKGKDPTSSGCKTSAIAENGGYTFYEIIPDGEEYTVAF